MKLQRLVSPNNVISLSCFRFRIRHYAFLDVCLVLEENLITSFARGCGRTIFTMSDDTLELGSQISLVSNAGIRYEGRLFTVDPDQCTIALSGGKITFNE